MMALSGTIMGLVGNAGLGNFLRRCGWPAASDRHTVRLVQRLSDYPFYGALLPPLSPLPTRFSSAELRWSFWRIAPDAEFPAGVKFMSWGSVFNVPFILVFFLLEVIGITYLVHFTTFGRSLFAMGRNIKASYYSGVKTGSVAKSRASLMNGMAASISSLFLISKLASARANMAKNYDMDIIAMVILGGVSVSGGKGSVIGTGDCRVHHWPASLRSGGLSTSPLKR